MKYFLAMSAISYLFVASTAVAATTTITFDDLGIVPSVQALGVSTLNVGGGFTIQGNGGNSEIINGADPTWAPNSGGNASRFLLRDFTEVLLRRADGQAFSLDSFDFHGWNPNASPFLTVNGLNAANVVVASQNFTITNSLLSPFQHAAPAGFTNVSSVQFVGSVRQIPFANGFSNTYLYSLDNIQVSTGSVVPEPAAWAMMIVGFGAAGSLLRRNRIAVA